MRLALFAREPENLPRSYELEDQEVEASAGIEFCWPFYKDQPQTIDGSSISPYR